MPQTTVFHEVADLYHPDPDATIEVTIRVSYSLAPAEPDVGIFSSYLDEYTVVSTDSDLFDIAQAEWWLYYTKEGQRALQGIIDDAGEYEDYEDDDRYDDDDDRSDWRD